MDAGGRVTQESKPRSKQPMYVQQIRERRCSGWTSVAYMEVGKGCAQERDC